MNNLIELNLICSLLLLSNTASFKKNHQIIFKKSGKRSLDRMTDSTQGFFYCPYAFHDFRKTQFEIYSNILFKSY